MKAFAVFVAGGLFAVVGLFSPLMPDSARVIFLFLPVPVCLVEFATLIGVYVAAVNEGLSMSKRRHIEDMPIPERVAPFAVIAMGAADYFIHVSWLADETPPFILLLFSSLGIGTILRIRKHRRALEDWGAAAAAGR